MPRYLTEFVGTFFLVFTIGLVVVGGSPSGALAIGTVLVALVYMGGHVSGAHYNPAVTAALAARGDLPRSDVAGYLIAQLLGAGAAGAATLAATGGSFALQPATDVGVGAALLVEVLFTFLLVLVILNVAVSARTKGNAYYGLAIGFTITGAAAVGGPISGGAFNPAAGVMPGLVQMAADGQTSAPLWLYVVGPLVGALLALPVFAVQESQGGRQ